MLAIREAVVVGMLVVHIPACGHLGYDPTSDREGTQPIDAGAFPPDGAPCIEMVYCGHKTASAFYQNGACVEDYPQWVNGLPSCGAANLLCHTHAMCNVPGSICHQTWDCMTCCE